MYSIITNESNINSNNNNSNNNNNNTTNDDDDLITRRGTPLQEFYAGQNVFITGEIMSNTKKQISCRNHCIYNDSTMRL